MKYNEGKWQEMAIFKNRPLAAACCLFILTVTCLSFLLSVALGITVIAAAALIVAVVACLLWRRGYSYKKLYLLLLMLGILLGGARSLIEMKQSAVLRDKIGSEQVITFTVEEVKSTNAFSS